jgi:hypothetical protein
MKGEKVFLALPREQSVLQEEQQSQFQDGLVFKGKLA